MRRSTDGYADPGTFAVGGPGRYLWWLVARQPARIAAGATLGTLWMLGLTVSPYLLSRAVDEGLRPGHFTTLLGWTAVLLAVGLLNAWVGVMRHRVMTRVRLNAAMRTVRVVVGQAPRLGAVLPARVSAGEVVTIGIGDVWVMARTLTLTGPGFGSAVAFVVVAALLLAVSPLLAAVVLVGVPALGVVVGPLLGRLHRTGSVYREREGALAARLVDIVGGLRVLNGLGGKGLYARRYRRGSRELRADGYRVGAVSSWIDALGVGLPALFLAAVTWLAARMAAQHTITVGELVAVYGYVAVLVVPVAFFIEGGFDLTRGLVAARRVIRFLTLRPGSADAADPVDGPAGPAVLRDPDSGVAVRPAMLTALASARPAESAAVVDRLGRFADSAVTWGTVRLDRVALAEVRERIVVADNEADLFAGTLRDVLAGAGDPDDAAIAGAIHTAVADDVVQGVPDGLDSTIDAQGRNLSGGQRQRVRLARALLADPEVLLAVEPTSAVDAHTEAAVAARLHEARSHRATVVTTTSPLLLDRADVVYHLVGGRVAAAGTHAELLRAEPGYRDLVARDAGDE
jgi:ABC-type multidrug transport system fused ATPase/permease subunit